ncbi:AAA family ATPase [Streptomyces sp. NPDC004250]|uniref:AAA family ATPase n=1 Tax=Streptomyces sp. NPDC004250 TaxID=3364692 RepID=UPI0036876E7F
MRLHSVSFNNYRRFAGESSLIIDEPIVALVGPNEAGKTSILEAILGSASRASLNNRDVARGVEDKDPKKYLVRLQFILEEEDLRAISSIRHADTPKWLTINLDIGKRAWSLSPTPGRDPADFERVVDLIDSTLLAGQVSASGGALPVPDEDPVSKALRQAQRDFRSFDAYKMRSISPSRLRGLDQALRYLGVVVHGDPDSYIEDPSPEEVVKGAGVGPSSRIDRKSYDLSLMENLATELVSLRKLLSVEPPAVAIGNLLVSRLPTFVKFNDKDRDLPDEFDLTVDAVVPQGLANLLRLARVDVEMLRSAAKRRDYPAQAELTEQANLELKDAFQAWRQETVWPILHISDGTLRVFVRVAHANSYSELHDRSDGLRQFIALLARINSVRYLEKEDHEVIVLIDEAENHLHYDAQADLIEVFTRQELVKQVIYSTHSAGCLPEDLGTGVRVIRPVPGTPHSSIQNWFWSDGAGFTPLLLGMGAATLAFASVRRVIVTEGPSDMLLLPSLLRQATGLRSLGYQIAPGLSELSPKLAEDIDLEAARSCFLVDGDAGGRALRKKLIDSGVPAERVMVLGGDASGLVLEDLVDEVVYRSCVNELLDGGEPNKIPVERELPEGNRHLAVKEWCDERGISAPGKRLIAQLLARRARMGSIVAVNRISALSDLHIAAAKLLG